MAEAHSNHGNTVAAWTTVGLIMVATLIMSIGVILTSLWVFLAGVLVVPIALVVGKLLSNAGYGMTKPDDNRVTRGVR